MTTMPPATVCQGWRRDSAGQPEHVHDCPVLLTPGDLSKPSHGLSPQCFAPYLQWAMRKVEATA